MISTKKLSQGCGVVSSTTKKTSQSSSFSSYISSNVEMDVDEISCSGSGDSNSVVVAAFTEENINGFSAAASASASGIMEQLVSDVSELQRSLTYLVGLFDTAEAEHRGADLITDAHKALTDVTKALDYLFQRYEFLAQKEVLDASSMLVKTIQALDENTPRNATDLSRVVDAVGLLQNATGERVGEYLTWEMDQLETGIYKNSDSMEDLITAGNAAISNRKPRRSLTFMSTNCRKQECFDADQLDEVLMGLDSGVDLAFARAKAWSNYCRQIVAHVQRRIEFETAHVKQLEKLIQATQEAVQDDTSLPLQAVHMRAFKQELDYCSACLEAMKNLYEYKFIKPLEARRCEEEAKRKSMRDNWKRQLKFVKDTAQELKKAKKAFLRREDSYRTARQTALKVEIAASEQSKIEKRRRVEEEAMIKREIAGKDCRSLEMRLEEKYQELQSLKSSIIRDIRELMMWCESASRSSTAAYFQILADLWAPISGQYAELSKSAKDYVPGSSYLQFVRQLPVGCYQEYNGHPKISISSCGSNSSNTVGGTTKSDADLRSDLNNSYSSRSSSNVLNPSPNEVMPNFSYNSYYVDISPETSSIGEKEFEEKSKRNSMLPEYSEAAQTHHYHKVRLPAKCCHCDTYTFFQTVQCTECGIALHKSCLSRLNISCSEANAKKLGSSAERRMSLFGVPLQIVVRNNAQGDPVPSVLRKCIDELDRRGARIKGLYRVCGVKSKIEQLCEDFEREDVDFGEVHPTSIASVVKLYLRQLPEPLLTLELYPKFIELARDIPHNNNCECPENSSRISFVERLKQLIKQLPFENLETLKFLILHLKRLTAYQDDNQMNASNLGIVFAPTLFNDGSASLSSLAEAPLHAKLVETLILHAYEIFDVDFRQERLQLERFQRSNDEEFRKERKSVDRPISVSADLSSTFVRASASLDDSGFVSYNGNVRNKSATPDLLKTRPPYERSRSGSNSTAGAQGESEQSEEETPISASSVRVRRSAVNRHSFPNCFSDDETRNNARTTATTANVKAATLSARTESQRKVVTRNKGPAPQRPKSQSMGDGEGHCGITIIVDAENCTSTVTSSSMDRSEQGRKPLFRRFNSRTGHNRRIESRKSLPIISILCGDSNDQINTVGKFNNIQPVAASEANTTTVIDSSDKNYSPSIPSSSSLDSPETPQLPPNNVSTISTPAAAFVSSRNDQRSEHYFVEQ